MSNHLFSFQFHETRAEGFGSWRQSIACTDRSTYLKLLPVANSVRCAATQGERWIRFPKIVFNAICTESKDASMSGFETELDGREEPTQTPTAPNSVEAVRPSSATIGRTLVVGVIVAV